MTITANNTQAKTFTFNLIKDIKLGESITPERVRLALKETGIEEYESEDAFALTHFFNGLVNLPTSVSGINRNFYGFGIDLRDAPAGDQSFDDLARINDVKMGESRTFFRDIIASFQA